MSAGPFSSESSSTGHAFAGASWLETRFAANKRAYELQARQAGFLPNMHLLDAGCGDGSYLPVLAEIVGPAGRIVAVDIDPENVATVEGRLEEWGLSNQVATQTGSVLSLPFDDASFDAIWCANVMQYLSDEELVKALKELRRVTTPRGLVAVKDSDATLNRLLPAPTGVVLRECLAAAPGDREAYGVLRSATLPAALRNAGFLDVRRVTTLLESFSPVSGPARTTAQTYLLLLSRQAADLEHSAEDREFWRQLRQPGAIDEFIDHPDFYLCEGNTMAVGRVP